MHYQFKLLFTTRKLCCIRDSLYNLAGLVLVPTNCIAASFCASTLETVNNVLIKVNVYLDFMIMRVYKRHCLFFLPERIYVN